MLLKTFCFGFTECTLSMHVLEIAPTAHALKIRNVDENIGICTPIQKQSCGCKFQKRKTRFPCVEIMLIGNTYSIHLYKENLIKLKKPQTHNHQVNTLYLNIRAM